MTARENSVSEKHQRGLCLGALANYQTKNPRPPRATSILLPTRQYYTNSVYILFIYIFHFRKSNLWEIFYYGNFTT